ncbi:MAG: nucleotidyl transferase AbiEii/AbiGii toxin family protein [Pirellulaceae bacterium]|nr:nucleotidyl transferase AbiEii/AbiGii toxin family protein [Pirellulaceae bacterium]MDG2105683.1 nucleotidyl transferase AbiEii/AbiGii toxin family protein [Pirellulaceae bacterium]
MSKRKVTDVAASVRARLLTYSKDSGRPFQEVLQYFAMERFLFRLSRSKHADKFVLKGGLMLTAWNAPRSRPTKDIDFLARMSNEVDVVANVVREVCTVAELSDGLSFDPESIEAVVIKEDADYEGVRVTFLGHLQNARIHMQIDMGFGDVVVPDPIQISYPTILDHDAPQIRGYPRETTIAEKFEAMVKLGLLNSRIRDFFDVWMLSRQFDFDGPTLTSAITRTFANRETEIESMPVAFLPEFTTDNAKQAQWQGFCRKSRIDFAPDSLEEVGQSISGFLSPVAEAIVNGEQFDQYWQAPGPWRTQ